MTFFRNETRNKFVEEGGSTCKYSLSRRKYHESFVSTESYRKGKRPRTIDIQYEVRY